jgi:hypothetical protein
MTIKEFRELIESEEVIIGLRVHRNTASKIYRGFISGYCISHDGDIARIQVMFTTNYKEYLTGCHPLTSLSCEELESGWPRENIKIKFKI